MSHHIPEEDDIVLDDKQIASQKIERDIRVFLAASEDNQIIVIPFGVSARSGKGNEYYRTAKAT